jgi:hypothetical protein
MTTQTLGRFIAGLAVVLFIAAFAPNMWVAAAIGAVGGVAIGLMEWD